MCVVNYYPCHIHVRSVSLSLNHVHSWHCAATTQDSTRFVCRIFQSFSILPGCPSPSCHVLYLRSWKQTNLPFSNDTCFICIYKSLIIRLFAFDVHGFELIILYNSLHIIIIPSWKTHLFLYRFSFIPNILFPSPAIDSFHNMRHIHSFLCIILYACMFVCFLFNSALSFLRAIDHLVGLSSWI